MQRYVILEHDHPQLHWDLMLEHGDALRTWRLAAPPCAGLDIAATALAEHRLAYLDYEGPVSGNRGTVKRWDHGRYAATVAEVLHLQLHGERVAGQAVLKQIAGADWVFTLLAQS
jgi:hypothetical protein